MKIFVLLISINFLFLSNIQGQNKHQNAIYFELLGNGGFYSVNYEKNIIDNFDLRIGAGYSDILYELWMFPVMINYHTDDRFSPEVGLGIVAGKINSKLFCGEKGTASGYALTSSLGVRYQAQSSGFILRLCATPLYNPDTKWSSFWGGLSVGFRF